MARVAINGLGRIGRATLKIVLDNPSLELAAVNDLTPPDNLAYLIMYDSVYGRYEKEVTHDASHLYIGGKRYRVFSEKDPAKLPWKDLGVDIVFECTGHFADRAGMQKHLDAGARKVILSTVAKSEDIPTVVYGVNQPGDVQGDLISCASCTTNSLTPVVEVVGRRIGVQKAIMTTVHAYTSTQSIVDGPNKKFRRGRAGAINFVPTSTGAAKATGRVLPQFQGKFDGVSIRGPVPTGSISDIVMLLSRPATVDEVNRIFVEEAGTDRYREVIATNGDMIVSSDIIQDPHAAIVDLTTTKVVDGDLLKVFSWYDNEWGYSSQMVRTAAALARILQQVGV